MLTKRQIEIIKELNDKDKLTAQNLASSLHVSTKTIPSKYKIKVHIIISVIPNTAITDFIIENKAKHVTNAHIPKRSITNSKWILSNEFK